MEILTTREAGSTKIDKDPIKIKKAAIETMVVDAATRIKENPEILKSNLRKDHVISMLYNEFRGLRVPEEFIKETLESIQLPENKKHLAEVLEEIKKGKRSN